MHELDQFYHVTTRLEVTLKDGNRATGKEFFFDLYDERGIKTPILVTNRHVLDDAVSLRFAMSLRDSIGVPQFSSYEWFHVNDPLRCFFRHPDETVDLISLPIAPLVREFISQGVHPFWTSLSDKMVADLSKEEAILPIENVLMVGYPVGIWDNHHNLPIVRKGITATHPLRNHKGRREFLVDVSCWPGSSGSPVFVSEWGSFTAKNGQPMAGWRFLFLGVVFASPMFTAESKITVVDIPARVDEKIESRVPMNLGIVIQAAEILRFREVIPNYAVITSEPEGNISVGSHTSTVWEQHEW